MARKEHDIDIEIGAEIDGVKLAFQEIRRQAAELRTQLKPTAEAMQEGFDKLGRQTLPHVAAKAEVAAEKLRAQAKKIAAEIDGMDDEIELDADVGPAKKAVDDLRNHMKKLSGQIKPTTDALRSDFARVGTVISGISGPIKGVAKLMAGVSFAGAAAGAWALHDAISKMRDATFETSTEIVRLQNALPTYGLTDNEDTADAIKQARAIEALFESFGMDESDARGILPVLAMEAKDAALGAEDALEKIRRFNIRYTDLFDDKGRLKDGVEQLEVWSDAVARLDEDTAKAALMGLLGDDDGVRALQILRMGGKELRKFIETNKASNALRNEDIAAAKALRAAAADEGRAWENLGISIARGFSPHMQEAIKARSEFLKGFTSEAQIAGDVGGEFYSSIVETLTDASSELLSILLEVEEGTASLETGLQRIAGLIDTIVDGIVDVVGYLVTGETDVPWINNAVQKLGEFKEKAAGVIRELQAAYAWVRDDAAPALAEFFRFSTEVIRDQVIPAIIDLWGYVDGFLSLFGIDETWEQVGVIAGLLVFQRTIVTVIGTIATLGTKLADLAGKTVALGGAATTAAGAATTASGAVAATAKQAVKKAGPIAAAVAAGKTAVDDADYMWYSDKAHDRAKEIAAEQGDAVAAGYLKAIQDALEERHGEGLLGGRLSRWVDENLGTDLFWDKDGAELEIALTVNEANAKEAARGAMLAFQEAGGWPVDDEGRIEIGAGFTISGAELKSGVIEGVQAQLDAAPLTLTLKQVDLLAGMEQYQIEIPAITAPASAEGGPANTTPLQPVNIMIDGKRIGGIEVPPDQVDVVRRSLEAARRARS